MIPIFHPYTGSKKTILRELEDSLDSRWWGQGPKVDKFERMCAKHFGYKYPLFVNSGTSAIELSYHLIGLKRNDEVIVPVLDCTAGQMGLKRRGVRIVFADIDRRTWNIDPDDVEKKITPKTKAIVGVHLGGIPFSNRIYEIGKRHGLPIITDSSQHHVRTRGDYICYSLQAIKHITTADGGLLVLSNEEEYRRAKLLRWFGIDREQKTKHNFQAWERRAMTFNIEEAGYKVQPTDIAACFGIASLPHLKRVIAYRQSLVREYKRLLRRIPQVRCVAGGSAWLLGILAERRDDLAEYLGAHEIECNMVHLRNDIYAIFGGRRQNLPNMDSVEPRYLYLPINTEVSLRDVRFVCETVAAYYKSGI